MNKKMSLNHMHSLFEGSDMFIHVQFSLKNYGNFGQMPLLTITKDLH